MPSIRRAGMVPLWLCIAALASSVVAIPQNYCSKENTGSDSTKTFSIYQSTGLCTDTCRNSGFSYAVLQGQNCWCSNSLPKTTQQVSDCNQGCPGFGQEQCGSTPAALFGYISLNSSPASSQQASPSSSSSRPTTSPSSSASPTQPYTSLVTITGQVQTVTITPSNGATAAPVNTGSSLSRSPGKIVGLAIGLTILLALIIAGIIFFLMWKRKRDRLSYQSSTSSPGSGQPMRMSTASAAGLGHDGHSRRSSTPGFTDQRLDPRTLYHHNQDNLSHRSFQDNYDYSRRVLKVTNPEE